MSARHEPSHRGSRRGSATVGLLAACLLLSSPGAAAAPIGDAVERARGPVVPGEAIVRFEPGASKLERREARGAARVELEEDLLLPRAEVVSVEGPVRAALRRLERQPEIAYAQPNYRYEATAVGAPDDTFFGGLWGLSAPQLPDPGVGVLEAWEESEGGGQTIAVVDTGVDLTHPDLAGNLWGNTLEGVLPGDGLDNDLNGQADDLHGYDFVDDDGSPDDYEFHGTHVAGTAAAIARNGTGIAGVAPGAEIMAVRVLDGDGSGSTADIASGIAYAAENGADVVNLSLGGPAGIDHAMSDAVNFAAAQDAVVVAAAGNDGVDNDVEPHSPCVLPQANLICVAALNQVGGLAGFYNIRAGAGDIAAPGTSILSARVDYGPPLFSSGFEPGTTELWASAAFNGGIEWGASSKASGGEAASDTQSAADSPAGPYGQAVDPAEFAGSELFTDKPVDLTGERGCRVHFRTMYETEPEFDYFLAGAGDDETLDFALLTGASADFPSGFTREEASISDLGGQPDVHPLFAVLSDESDQRDGAYVDDVRLICRDGTYADAIASGAESDLPNAGNYVRFQGTSMATPHVSGVIALVRAAAPDLSAVEAVEAVLAGASAIPAGDPSRRTRTEGIADACQAIALATGGDVGTECPGSSENVPAPPPVPAPSQPAAVVTALAPKPQQGPSRAGDTRRPDTFFGERPPKVVRTRGRMARVVFRFGSDEAGVGFVCRLDGAPYRPCRARMARRVRLGRHVVRALARDAAGNVDASAAVHRFWIKRRGG